MSLMKRFFYFSALVLTLLLSRAVFAADDAKVPAPKFSLASGTFASAQTVKVIGSTPNASLYCTTNGDKPTASSPKCPAEIAVAKTLTLKAVVVTVGGAFSEIASATYTIHDQRWSVLRKLDDAAAKFKSTSADFEFDSVVTVPVSDTEKQTGKVYYNRKGDGFDMGMHIEKIDDKPVPKVIVVSGGVFKMYEKITNQVTTSNKAGKYAGYLVLAFGASGNDLEQKWDIKYLGSETLKDGNIGVKTEKLELVAKDPEVLKIFPKVIVWIDPERGVSLKQFFDEGQGQSRTCLYSNIKVNQKLLADAFTLPTDTKTTYVNR